MSSPREPAHQIGGKEGRVGGDGDDEAALRPVRLGPGEAGMNACKRPHLAGEKIREPAAIQTPRSGRIVIGVEHDLGDLRAQALDDMGEQRPPAKRQQRLVAAAHAARFAAGKHDPDHAVR